MKSISQVPVAETWKLIASSVLAYHQLSICRIGVRSIRQKLMQQLGRLERDGELSRDEQHRLASSIQAVTDRYIAEIDDLLGSH